MPKPGPYSSHARWTYEEEELVHRYYVRYGPLYLARRLGRSPEAVRSRAQMLNVKGRARRWKAPDITLLKKNYGHVPLTELARQLGRSASAVTDRARALGLTVAAPKWSNREIEYVRANYKKIPAAAIAQHLGRSENSVMDKAKKLGLARTVKPVTDKVVRTIMRDVGRVSMERIAAEVGMSVQRVATIAREHGYQPGERQWWKKAWTPEEDAYLRASFAATRNIDIAQHLGCSLPMVENRARALGLPKKKKHSGRKGAVARQQSEHEGTPRERTTSGPSAGTQSAEMQRTPDASRHRRWTAQEVDLLRQCWEHLSVNELAERLGRNPESVRSRLLRLGLNRRLPNLAKPWSDEEEHLLAELYDSATYPEIARRLGRTVSSVASRAGRLGLPERSRK